MSDDERSGADDPRDPDRSAILARRKRWVALALAGAAAAATSACPGPCLHPLGDGGGRTTDAGDAGTDDDAP